MKLGKVTIIVTTLFCMVRFAVAKDAIANKNLPEEIAFDNVYEIGNGYYWATTNLSNKYPAALLSPNKELITDFKYKLYRDDAISQTPWVLDEREQCFMTSKIKNGDEKKIILFMDGTEVEYDELGDYWSLYGCAYRLKNNKFSILNFLTKKLIDCAEYDEIRGHSRYPVVRLGEKWGVTDIYGRPVLPPIYDSVKIIPSKKIFHDETVVFRKDGTKYIVELPSGRDLQATNEFYFLSGYKSQTISGENYKVPFYGLATTDGKLVQPAHYRYLKTLDNGYIWAATNFVDFSSCTAQLLSPDGIAITEPVLKIFMDEMMNVTPYFFSSGALWTQRIVDGNPVGLLLYPDGTLISTGSSLGPYYGTEKTAVIYSQGYAKLWDIEKRNFITTPLYDEIDLFYNGAARARISGKWGIINEDGKIILPLKYMSVRIANWEKGVYTVHDDEYCGLIDSKGKWIIPFKRNHKNFKEKSEAAIRDYPDNRVIVLPKTAKHYNKSSDNRFVRICKENKWGFTDNNGNNVVDCVYDDVKEVRNNHFRAKSGGKWGIFALDGTCKLPPEYDEIYSPDEYEKIDFPIFIKEK